jgi:alanine racemase
MHSNFLGNILTINLSKIAENYATIQQQLSYRTDIGAVVKSNAYGIGAKEITTFLNALGCKQFFVSTWQEGVEIRSVTDELIYVLHGIDDPKITTIYIEQNLTPVLNHLGQIALWNQVGREQKHKVKAMLNLETGLGRIGLDGSELRQLLARPELIEYIDITYIMSHLACAEQYSHPQNRAQLATFRELFGLFTEKKASLANSAATFLGQDYHFDLVRIGCALFGINPSSHLTINPMQSVVELQGYILQHKIIEKDQNIGYRALHRAKKGDKFFILSCGYVDGYSRFMSDKGFCYAHGKFLPIVGIVGMDMTIVDASALPEALFYATNHVELLGKNISIDDVGKYANNIGYELIITKFNNKLKRIYTNA